MLATDESFKLDYEPVTHSKLLKTQSDGLDGEESVFQWVDAGDEDKAGFICERPC